MSFQVKRGDVLIAGASLMDPTFARSVVLICDHSEQDGTFGLVLNRPISVPDELRESLAFELDRLYQGGPVRVEAMQVIHPYGDRVPQCFEVLPGLWIGGDFEVMSREFRDGDMDPRRCRFCLGYAGWGQGQLADEFRQNAWLVTRGSVELVLETPVERLWHRAVREYGRDHPMFRYFPDDLSYN